MAWSVGSEVKNSHLPNNSFNVLGSTLKFSSSETRVRLVNLTNGRLTISTLEHRYSKQPVVLRFVSLSRHPFVPLNDWASAPVVMPA